MEGLAVTKHTPLAEAPQFLSGWKEVANFLGKGVRTVQRYERELGLPVRRPAGKARGSVVAVKAELDGWVKASPYREEFHLRPVESPFTEEIKVGLSELARLREQMITLRAEMKNSLQRLQASVHVLQGEVAQRQTHRFSTLYSMDERDLLDRTAPNVIALPIKYPKVS